MIVKIIVQKLYSKTKKYQKFYGFELNKGENDVKNNEVGILKRK